MDEKKTVTQIIESVCERFCDEYCKYAEKAQNRIDGGFDLPEVCDKCPLNELY